MKDPKKVQAGKRLAEYNRERREDRELKVQKSESKQVEPTLTSSQYGIGAILAVGVIGGLYQAKKGEVNAVPPHQPSHPHPKANKFEME